MRDVTYKVLLAGGMGAIIGLCVGYLMNRGKIEVLGWSHMVSSEAVVFVLLFSAFGVVFFWALPAAVLYVMRRFFE
jgi:uncharacterized protein YacL